MKNQRLHHLIFLKILIPYASGLMLSYADPVIQLVIPAPTTVKKLLLILILLIIVCLCIINYRYKYLKAYHFKSRTGMLFQCLFLMYGIWSGLMANQLMSPDHFSRQYADFLKIRITDEPRHTGTILKFTAEVTHTGKFGKEKSLSGPLTIGSGKLKLSIKTQSGLSPLLNYGDVLLIPSNYKSIPPTEPASQFNYSLWLANRNIYHQSILQVRQIRKIRKNNGNPMIRYALQFRKRQLDYLAGYMRDKDAFAVAATLILGQRADLSVETMNIYTTTGTVHALSVSGMHVGLIYLVLRFIFTLCGNLKFVLLFRIPVILVSIWYYTILTGLSASVLRSAIMLSMLIISKRCSKITDNYHILTFTACVMLFYDPILLHDIGFQLSFFAVAGLIYLQPKLTALWTIKNRWLMSVWSSITLSCSAQLFTFPLSIYYFHQFPVYFLIGNLFIGIPIAALMYMGLAILMLRLTFLIPVFEWLILFVNKGLGLISALPFANISGIWINKAELVFLCLIIIVFLAAFRQLSQQLFVSGMFLLLLFQLSSTADFLNAGQQRMLVRVQITGDKIAVAIHGQSALVFSREKTDELLINKHLKPLLAYYRVRHVKIHPLKYHLEESTNPYIFGSSAFKPKPYL